MSLEEIPLHILCTADGYGPASKVSFHREIGFCSNSRSCSLRRIIAIANPVFMWRLSSEELRMFWHHQNHCFFIPVRKRGSCFHSFFVDGESGAPWSNRVAKVTDPISSDAFWLQEVYDFSIVALCPTPGDCDSIGSGVGSSNLHFPKAHQVLTCHQAWEL